MLSNWIRSLEKTLNSFPDQGQAKKVNFCHHFSCWCLLRDFFSSLPSACPSCSLIFSSSLVFLQVPKSLWIYNPSPKKNIRILFRSDISSLSHILSCHFIILRCTNCERNPLWLQQWLMLARSKSQSTINDKIHASCHHLILLQLVWFGCYSNNPSSSNLPFAWGKV